MEVSPPASDSQDFQLIDSKLAKIDLQTCTSKAWADMQFATTCRVTLYHGIDPTPKVINSSDFLSSLNFGPVLDGQTNRQTDRCTESAAHMSQPCVQMKELGVDVSPPAGVINFA